MPPSSRKDGLFENAYRRRIGGGTLPIKVEKGPFYRQIPRFDSDVFCLCIFFRHAHAIVAVAGRFLGAVRCRDWRQWAVRWASGHGASEIGSGPGARQTLARLAVGGQRVTGCETADFGATLNGWVSELTPGIRALVQGTGFDKVLDETQRIRGTLLELKGRREESNSQIEALRAEVSRARQEALSDMLTGLANRRAFDAALASLIASAEDGAFDNGGLSLIIAEIDHFQKVNDSYGHLFGDKVLRPVAQILRSNTKGQDVVARYGGEEFAVLLPNTALPGAVALADSLRAAVENGCIRRSGDATALGRVTLSLGVAAYCPSKGSVDFLRRTDEALYRAKREGRNRLRAASAQYEGTAVQRPSTGPAVSDRASASAAG